MWGRIISRKGLYSTWNTLLLSAICCPSVCPSTMNNGSSALYILGAAEEKTCPIIFSDFTCPIYFYGMELIQKSQVHHRELPFTKLYYNNFLIPSCFPGIYWTKLFYLLFFLYTWISCLLVQLELIHTKCFGPNFVWFYMAKHKSLSNGAGHTSLSLLQFALFRQYYWVYSKTLRSDTAQASTKLCILLFHFLFFFPYKNILLLCRTLVHHPESLKAPINSPLHKTSLTHAHLTLHFS